MAAPRTATQGGSLPTQRSLNATEPVPAGDLLAVACTGAYHHSMASTYNMVGRPPVIALHAGTSRVLIRRVTEDDLFLRDVSP